MRQETTTINADELFGNFSDPGEFQDCKDGFEKYWQWPDEVGNGFMSVINLRPGLMLGIGDYQLHESIAVSFGWKSPPVVMGFNVSINFRATHGYGQAKKDVFMFNSGQSFIFYLPEWQGVAKHPVGTPVRSVGIYMDPLLFNTFMEGQHDHIPTCMHDIVKGADEGLCYHALTTTPAVNMAIHQILDCPYRGPLKRLYLESKTLELIAHNLAQLIVDKNGHNRPFTLLPSDIERVREARDVLIRNMDNPPSLLELARQAGINKDKLNHGFRQVFGTSVFDYLRIHRLGRARELLESKEKNVTEVAFEVGYAQHCNFTKAFKKHFGINPTDLLR